MRFLFARIGVCWVLLACSVQIARADERTAVVTIAARERPALLDAAFNAFAEHQGRWAFTETHSAGQPPRETILRVDPSLTYAEQFKPIKIRGEAPSEKQLKFFAEIGEKKSKRRQDAELEKNPQVHRDDEVKLQISGQVVIPDLAQAVVVAEDENGVTYQVPMRKDGGDALFEKFQLTCRVNKHRREFERATIRQCAAMRVKLIAKVKDSVIEIEFGSPDPRYPALPMKITQQCTFKVLWGKEHRWNDESQRTEVKHVTPYDERFGVKIGTVKTIEL